MSATTQATVITEPGIYELDEATYLADPVPGGSLSSTGARRILDSPARFQWEQAHPRTSVAFDVGHALHAKVLGVGSPVITYPDEHLTPSGSVSTKAATVAWVDEQRTAGLVVLSAADYDRVEAMAEAVLAHPAARRILEQQASRAEASVFGRDPETGVMCRARFDVLADTTADLKTTAGSASPVGFGKEAARYGYPIQEAHYLDTLRWATGDDAPPMAFIIVEKSPPHLVAVHHFDEITRMVARELAAKARRIYAECTATDTWPGYSDDPLITQVPSWWLDLSEDTDEMVV